MARKSIRELAAAIVTPAAPVIKRIHPHYPIYLERSITANTPASVPAPVVILLGWTDGQLKYLAKGALYYRFRGYNIIYYQANSRHLWFPYQVNRIASALIPTLDSLAVVTTSSAGSSSPIVQSSAASPFPPALVLHTFSNGGCLGLWGLLGTLRAHKVALFTPRAIIFDSSPGIHSMLTLPRIYTADVKSPLKRGLIWTSVLVANTLFSPLYRLCMSLARRTVFLDAVKEVMKDPSVNSVPRLFLYSTKDKLVPYKSTEGFVEQAERLSGNLEAEDGKQERAVVRIDLRKQRTYSIGSMREARRSTGKRLTT